MSYYVNDIIDWTSLIKITNNGLVIASYEDIKKAIINKYKSVYGEDIDISTNSADGIYLEFYSLMINNILQNLQTLYSNLDIKNAYGYYLDILADLKNIKRKKSTKSMAIISIINTSNSSIDIVNGTKFLDINGQTWSYTTESIIKLAPTITLEGGEVKSIIVFADSYGPVSCIKGTINQPVDMSLEIQVSQSEDGILGIYQETDSDLKARAISIRGINSLTTLANMSNNLYSFLGIKDVRIYNNVEEQEFEDGTIASAHSTYIVLRKLENLELSNENIGRVIYNSSTPGIPTTGLTEDVTVKAGIIRSSEIKQVINGVELDSTAVDIYWKEALPIRCSINVEITPLTNFSNNTYTLIEESVKSYLNNIRIGEKINEELLRATILASDPLFLGEKTFTLDSITYKDVEGGAATFTSTIPDNYNSYYNFNSRHSSGDISFDSLVNYTVSLNGINGNWNKSSITVLENVTYSFDTLSNILTFSDGQTATFTPLYLDEFNNYVYSNISSSSGTVSGNITITASAVFNPAIQIWSGSLIVPEDPSLSPLDLTLDYSFTKANIKAVFFSIDFNNVIYAESNEFETILNSSGQTIINCDSWYYAGFGYVSIIISDESAGSTYKIRFTPDSTSTQAGNSGATLLEVIEVRYI